jgi:hypothetical protein
LAPAAPTNGLWAEAIHLVLHAQTMANHAFFPSRYALLKALDLCRKSRKLDRLPPTPKSMPPETEARFHRSVLLLEVMDAEDDGRALASAACRVVPSPSQLRRLSDQRRQWMPLLFARGGARLEWAEGVKPIPPSELATRPYRLLFLDAVGGRVVTLSDAAAGGQSFRERRLWPYERSLRLSPTFVVDGQGGLRAQLRVGGLWGNLPCPPVPLRTPSKVLDCLEMCLGGILTGDEEDGGK